MSEVGRLHFRSHLRTVTSQRPHGGNITVKMADCRSDVEFKNDENCAYDENN